MFYPRITFLSSSSSGENSFLAWVKENEEEVESGVKLVWNNFTEILTQSMPQTASEKEKEGELCRLTFLVFVKLTKMHPPWGMLTGVRPLGIYFREKRKGKSESEILECYISDYFVLPEKAHLALEAAQIQQPIRDAVQANSYSLYISIPFCPTRCHYCSFISQGIPSAQGLIPEYLELLQKELMSISKIAEDLQLQLDCIYIGGGTPTVLSASQLEKLLHVIGEYFPITTLKEYTVEAGRPDTITKSKLQVLKNQGVSRISINPQTLNPTVLKSIGRGHTVEDFYSAYSLAQSSEFSVINTDFIAGLPGESNESFLQGITEVLPLAPQNITIHTLTLKKSSHFREDGESFSKEENLTPLLRDCQSLLSAKGYHPYYIYRQKGTRQNQENTGYSLAGKESFYNASMMEDIQTILGAGAGSTSKFVPLSGKIQRIYNYKYPFEYMKDFETILQRKEKVRKLYERNKST